MATRLKLKAKRSVKNDDKGSDKSLDEHDTAVLSKPVTTSINNLLKIIKLYQNTTEEIRQYLTAECDILYECRVCRNIFRSISNFILHKRKYCPEKFSHVTYSKWFNNDDDYLDIIQKDTCSDSLKNEKDGTKLPKKNLNSIIDGLTQKKQTDLEIEKLFSEHKENQETDPNIKNKSLDLEYIEGSHCGVFQSMNSHEVSKKEETMKLEIMEMYRLTEGHIAILGPDGKVANQKPVSGLKDNENTNLTCPKCNINFSTRKTLLSHIKYKHESERVVYPCTECTETFATVWSVYRHLYNIHHKTLAEVRKMRPRIKAKSIKNEGPVNRKNEHLNDNLNDQQKIDEENQAWMDNFESDNDIQMCGGCGRRFERKAALNSHSQTCQKRITARNIINVNKQKRIAAQEDKPGDKKKPAKVIKLDTEPEKKNLSKDKINSESRRKIGIQIRYDYNKTNDKNIPSPSNTQEDTDSKKKITPLNNETSTDSPQNSQSSDKKIFDKCNVNTNLEGETNKSNSSSESDLLDEVVSIPSSTSSPNKEEQDPLALKDVPSDSDCEIEEILGPIEHSIFGSQPSKLFDEVKEGESDDEDMQEQYKVASINESTLKLIKLINSDIPVENTRPTLDEKMTNYVNTKKLKCIPCDTKFGNISKLRHHMALHFNWNRFRCDICTFKAYDKIDVFEHIKRDHNITEFEKIEAVILQIPDWETTELSSDVFIEKKDIEMNSPSKTSGTTEEKKEDNKELESTSGSISPDNCIIIESNETDDKQLHKKQNLSSKTKKKSIKTFNDVAHVTADSVPKDPLSDNQSEEVETDSRSSSRSNQDSELKKMVYEVIFGQDITVTKPAVANCVSAEEKDNVHVVPNDVSNVISRPVRNRVKPLLYKDFIYDLHGFKEHHKTVFVSNSNPKAIPLVNNISDSLEDLHNNKKPNNIRLKKSLKKSNKFSFGAMDNTDKNLNLQKRAIENFADNQILNDERFPENVVSVLDSKGLNESNQSDGEDHDIYIVENEELVAIK